MPTTPIQPVDQEGQKDRVDFQAVHPIMPDLGVIGNTHTSCSPENQRAIEKSFLHESIKNGLLHQTLGLSDLNDYAIIEEKTLVNDDNVVIGREYTLNIQDHQNPTLANNHLVKVEFVFEKSMLKEENLHIKDVISSAQAICKKPIMPTPVPDKV